MAGIISVAKAAANIIDDVPAGMGRLFDDALKTKAVAMLRQNNIYKWNAGKKKDNVLRSVGELSKDDLARALRDNNIPLYLSPEELPPELTSFGFTTIPGYDYAGGVNQLSRLTKDEQSEKLVRAAILQNIGAAENLYWNPASPVYRRIVGNETNPDKIRKLIEEEIQRNDAFYPDFNEDLFSSYGQLDPYTVAGLQSPLSAGSGPPAELLTGSTMLEVPEQMFSTPPAHLRQVYGNMGTTYGKDSILDALRVGLQGRRWMRDDSLLSSKGGVFKIGSYARNKLAPGSRWTLPGEKASQNAPRGLERLEPVTNDRQAVVSMLGGFRPMGDTIANSQDAYNYMSGVMREAALQRGIDASALQARIWFPQREFMNNEVAARLPVGRLINASPEAVRAFGPQRDPRGMLAAARQAAESEYKNKLASAVTAADRKAAKKILNETIKSLDKISKQTRGYATPEMAALAALMGGGGLAAASNLGGSNQSPDTMEYLARRQAARNLYGGPR